MFLVEGRYVNICFIPMSKVFHIFIHFKHEYLITNMFRYRHCELKVYNTSQRDILYLHSRT